MICSAIPRVTEILRLDVENLRDDEVQAIVDAFAELAATPASDRPGHRPPGLDDVARRAQGGEVGDRIPGHGHEIRDESVRMPPTVPCSPSAAAASDVIARIARHGSKPRSRA